MKRQLFVCYLVFLGLLCVWPTCSWGQDALIDVMVAVSAPGANNGQGNGPPVVDDAPAGFHGSNGYTDPATFAEDRDTFDEFETIEDGLGPLYNAQSCRECHQNPISGSSSQITEKRVGHNDEDGVFRDPEIPIQHGRVIISGRSLINDRAICPNEDFPKGEIQERVPLTETIRTFRISLNLLGDGFVEAVADKTLEKLAQDQCKSTGNEICGQLLYVPVLEAPGAMRLGRFGWKNQQASILSFAADAYLNEMGVTNRLQPDEVTTVCNPRGIAEPNDTENDIDVFARFIRATKAPARDEVLARTEDATEGEEIFTRIGCAICHVPTLETEKAGKKINGGKFIVPDALGDKQFHPYGDFLLHDVGTGDGIVQSWTEHYGREVYDHWKLSAEEFNETQYKMRTAPLWGVRFRPELMHDGESLTFLDAIKRHGGEASQITRRFLGLSPSQQLALFEFLKSL